MHFETSWVIVYGITQSVNIDLQILKQIDASIDGPDVYNVTPIVNQSVQFLPGLHQMFYPEHLHG